MDKKQHDAAQTSPGTALQKKNFRASALGDDLANMRSMEGFLEKKNRKGRWQRRFFEIVNMHLTYKKSRGGSKILASLDLREVRCIVERVDGSACAFGLELAFDGSMYHLRASSAMEATQWVSVLKQRHASVADRTDEHASSPAHEDVKLLPPPVPPDQPPPAGMTERGSTAHSKAVAHSGRLARSGPAAADAYGSAVSRSQHGPNPFRTEMEQHNLTQSEHVAVMMAHKNQGAGQVPAARAPSSSGSARLQADVQGWTASGRTLSSGSRQNRGRKLSTASMMLETVSGYADAIAAAARSRAALSSIWQGSELFLKTIRPQSKLVRALDGAMRPVVTTSGKLREYASLRPDDSVGREELFRQKIRLVVAISEGCPRTGRIDPKAKSWFRRVQRMQVHSLHEVCTIALGSRSRHGGDGSGPNEVVCNPAYLQMLLAMLKLVLFERDWAVCHPPKPRARGQTMEEAEHNSDLETDGEGEDMDGSREGEDGAFDAHWPLLSKCYQLLRFILEGQAPLEAKEAAIDAAFVYRLIDNFNSPDWRERDAAMASLHALYAMMARRRRVARRAIQDALLTFTYDTHAHRGIAHLLSIQGSILAGCAKLRPEHVRLMHNVLLPLHGAPQLEMFQEGLCVCLVMYLKKDPLMLDPIIRGLLRYWAHGNSAKELLLLDELQECVAQVNDKLPATHIGLSKLTKLVSKRLRAYLHPSANCLLTKKVLIMMEDDALFALLARNKTELPTLSKALKGVAHDLGRVGQGIGSEPNSPLTPHSPRSNAHGTLPAAGLWTSAEAKSAKVGHWPPELQDLANGVYTKYRALHVALRQAQVENRRVSDKFRTQRSPKLNFMSVPEGAEAPDKLLLSHPLGVLVGDDDEGEDRGGDGLAGRGVGDRGNPRPIVRHKRTQTAINKPTFLGDQSEGLLDSQDLLDSDDLVRSSSFASLSGRSRLASSSSAAQEMLDEMLENVPSVEERVEDGAGAVSSSGIAHADTADDAPSDRIVRLRKPSRGAIFARQRAASREVLPNWLQRDDDFEEQEERSAIHRSSSAKRMPTLQDLNAPLDGTHDEVASRLDLEADNPLLGHSIGSSSNHRPQPEKDRQKKVGLSPSREAGKGRHSI
eukprot:g580.t1